MGSRGELKIFNSMKDLKNIEDLFKETFNDFEIAPPAELKTVVDQAINEKKKGSWWLPVLALLMLAIIPFVYYLLSDSKIDTPSQNSTTHKNLSTTQLSESNTGVEFTKTNENNASQRSISKTEKTIDAITNSSNQSKQQHSTINKNQTTKNNIVSNENATFSKRKNTPPMKQKKGSVTTVKISESSAKPANANSKTNAAYADNNDSPKNNKNGMTQELSNESNSNGSNDISASNNIDSVMINKENDSLNTPITLSKSYDSSDSPSVFQTTSNKSPKTNDLSKQWYASVYLGPQFDFARSSEKLLSDLNSKPAFDYSLEINKTIFSGFGITTGIGGINTKDVYTRYTYIADSTYTVDTIPLYDPNNPDSIIGYNGIETLHVDNIQRAHSFKYTISSMVIPIYVSKQFDFGNNWGMLLNTGLIYRMNKIKGGPVTPYSEEPIINKNSFMISGRVHATYKWNNWMFSLGMNAGYYIKPPVNYPNIKTNRSYFNPEIGIHFNF